MPNSKPNDWKPDFDLESAINKDSFSSIFNESSIDMQLIPFLNLPNSESIAQYSMLFKDNYPYEDFSEEDALKTIQELAKSVEELSEKINSQNQILNGIKCTNEVRDRIELKLKIKNAIDKVKSKTKKEEACQVF
ncbi:hypothetical protein SteCoe_37410 [Stentor coeruleus]|uniref:Uncharacterized protein n=1 Tax=Stentor coeruleus TaxID=5963 RepID=A0A1R2AN31_9CILI|nr:hypothetical protein SteCoe_37410 [Stentor coeruleus]